MTTPSTPSNGQTRLAYILGVPLGTGLPTPMAPDGIWKGVQQLSHY
ncbi:hypothetical protein [Mycobacterium rhizamassiliense]|nr:hypothetical protein [Mycobacterium rhizamassiliense]